MDLAQIQQWLTIAAFVVGILAVIVGYFQGRNLVVAWASGNALQRVQLVAQVMADAAQGIAAAVEQWAAMQRRQGKDVSPLDKHKEGYSRLFAVQQDLRAQFPDAVLPGDLDTVLLAGVAKMKAKGLEQKRGSEAPARGPDGRYVAKRE